MTTVTADREVASIDSTLVAFQKAEKNVTGQSAEGGKLTAYSSSATFRRIDAEFYGEDGRSNTSYYMTDTGLLFFVRDEVVRYEMPLANAPPHVVSSSTSRYYLSGGNLLKADTNGKPIAADPKKATLLARNLADDIAQLQSSNPP